MDNTPKLETTLGEAFANTNVQAIVGVLREEKAFKSAVNRLDKVCNKELDRNEFRNISLVLRAVESLCESDEEAVHSFVQQGLVVKMLGWFERATGFLRLEEMKSVKGLANLIEEFYDVSMSICRMSLEGKGQIQDVFVLKFGMLVIDGNISFTLRLEAIRTINSILDRATKEERKKFTLSDDHCLLLQEFAKVVLSVGDYEMQVAISEALCRMTVRKCREELVYKWFSNPAFGDSFKAINDREFETDCRKFLNEVNNSFGDERRVVTFPCVKAFLDLTELFMPDDKNLDKFWIDFNIGTSCISFFVNDPEGTLWESINLPKTAVSGYNVLGCDEQKILTVQMAIPVSHSKAKGRSIQIIFDAQYDIGSAVKRAFGDKQWQRVQSEEHPALVVSETPAEESQNVQEAVPCPSTSVTTEQADVAPVGQREKPEATSLPERAGTFQLDDHSDTEVVRAKARLFSHSASSNGAALSTPVTGEKQKESQKIRRTRAASESDGSVSQGERGFQRRGSDRFDYTRKKLKTKATLKILPLSSASSTEEPDVVKHSTPTLKSLEREEEGELTKRTPFPASKDQRLDISAIPTFPGLDSGFPEETVLNSSGFSSVGQDKTSTKDPKSSKVTSSPLAAKRKTELTAPVLGLAPEKRQVLQAEGQPNLGLKPRKLFPSSPPRPTTDKATTMLPEDTESETEMGSAVVTAFQTFKNQLREHFSSRYKKIESRSLKSLTDCQNHVTSLLGTVHRHRLLHLERFQATVVNELNNLERDCHSLKDIEKETVNFWRTESQAVALFCDKQQRRLRSLESLRKDSKSRTAEEDVASSSQTTR
ncbi:synaptonemal complex protein 2-like isoform X2 [Conger conger]|uniref:synaptonemal complex protein 2-like isoform X2 n=1 Tax=Conger conger TaxID=82655 RepID=UPI002A5A4880|nr:synaptonemal complex protein 2-like isoform X2 [Conger conger]